MKQLVAALVVLVVVVGGLMWATSRSSSAQEQDSPPETTVPEEEATPTPEEFGARIDEFLNCLRDEGIEVPDVEQGAGRFGFHFNLDTDDLEALNSAHEACGDDIFSARPFAGEFFSGDIFPFGDEVPFGGSLHGGFGFGLGEALDVDQLAECLTELGTFENVDEVKAQLELCLPTPGDFGLGDIESWLQENGIDGEGFPFEGRGGFGFFNEPGGFGFDFDFDGDFGFDNSDGAEPAVEGASA